MKILYILIPILIVVFACNVLLYEGIRQMLSPETFAFGLFRVILFTPCVTVAYILYKKR